MAKPGVLFVDDNENILQGLRRNLRPMHQEWDLHFATGGAEALKLMGEKPVDVIVSDMRMPGMDGSELLRQVREKYGRTIRLVLSGQCDEESILTLLGVSHQYMAKPMETSVVISTIKPILAAKMELQDEGLRTFVTGISMLPSLPVLQEAIISELQSDRSDIHKVESLLLRDISLVAKIFQVMNSSYFGPSQDVNSVSYVWEVLGLEKIKSLILNNHIAAPIDAAFEGDLFLADLWEISLMTARMARHIAKVEELPPKVCDKLWVAGLLHAIGAVILYEYPRKTGTLSNTDSLLKLEGPDPYTAVGGFLALLWGLPRDIRQAILYHAAPSKADQDADKQILAIIHAAWALAHEKLKRSAVTLDQEFLRQANAEGKIEVWRTTATAALA
jgi:HD-like signal output (HDOD) protein/ActR/RegA family two-component response regulator